MSRRWLRAIELLASALLFAACQSKARIGAPRASDVIGALRAHPSSPLQPAVAVELNAVTGGLSPGFAASAERVSARVVLPAKATAPVHIEDLATGLGVDVVLEDARQASAEARGGYVVYPNGHASGASLVHRPLPSGSEDFLYFETAPAASEIGYRTALGPGVSGLRLVAGSLEMLDAGGAPRLRVAPPYLVDADGVRTDATLAVTGCAVDTSPAAPWGRAVTAPGARSCRIRVAWPSAAVVYPAVLDPRWTTTGSMTTPRQGHTATSLSTGNVLVVGGTSNGSTALASAELYNRATGTWAATASMTGARALHSATQLNTSSNGTTSGKVLIAGGINGTTSQNTAQLYSPTAGTWAAAANLNAARHGYTATLMPNGNVLAAGGLNGTTVLATAAIYNPTTGTGTWTPVATSMASARRAHTASLLASSNTNFNNKVLIVGGNSGGTTSLTTVQLFDTTALTWSTTTALASAREGQTATTLANGNVLVTGGKGGATTLATALVFTIPTSGTAATWANAGTMTSARSVHSATLLPALILTSGSVLVAGGSNGTSTVATAELWNGTSTWTATTALSAAVQGHTATLLASGAVLIAGGLNGTTTVGSAAVFDPSFALACTTNSQCTTGFCASGVCCDTACNGGCGACNLAGKVGTCSAAVSGITCRAAAGSCDAVEVCNGTSLTCPTDAFLPATTQCRAAAAECDVAESCTGTSASCPADAKKGNGMACTDDGNPCTTDRCDGTNAACQHAAGNNGTACPDDGNLCTTDTCNGTSTMCQHPAGNNGTACADDENPCTTDRCDGINTTCQHPAGNNGTACTDDGNPCTTDRCDGINTTCQHPAGNSGTACPDDGNPCTTDTCNGSSTTCQHPAGNTGVTCRAAGGECDAAETCTGTSTACPADAKKVSGTACTDDGNACTTDKCDGTNVTCQHAAGNAGTVCRAAGGECDQAETCTGTSTACPTDGRKPSGTVCTDDGNACTTDKCDGTTVTCQHAAGNAGTVCRAAGGECDQAETCTGTSMACPTDGKKPSGTVCTDDGNACTTDKCDGTTVTCQHAAGNNGAVCPDDGNPCTTDACNGTSTTCQHAAGNAGTVCRVAAGECDQAETCTGTSTTCPTDGKKASGTVCTDDGNACTTDKCDGMTVTCQHAAGNAGMLCRVAAGPCDVAEACTGSSTACPVNAFKPNGTTCDDGNVCTQNDVCSAGSCTGGTPVTCPPPDQCHTVAACVPAIGCPAAIPKPDGASCGDGNACTRTDTCQAGTCVGGNPVVCATADSCHTSSCDPATGTCSTTAVGGTCDLGAFDYDKAGRLIRDRSTQLGYDGYDQLRTVVPIVSPPPIVNLSVEDLEVAGETQALPGHVNASGHVPVGVTLPSGVLHTVLFRSQAEPEDINAAAGIQTSLFASGINDTDALAGTLTTATGSFHAFRYDQAGFHDLGNPGDFTVAYDLNGADEVVGFFSAGGVAHGYRHTDAAGFQEIGTLGGTQSWAFNIDEQGVVAGSAQTPSSPASGTGSFGHAVLFRDVVGLQDLNTLVDPTTGVTLMIANEHRGDWVVGSELVGGVEHAYRLRLSTGTLDQIIWPGLTFGDSVNDGGDIVGWGYLDAANTQQAAWLMSDRTGLVKLNDLIDPAIGWDLRVTSGIDDLGDVVGWGYHNGRVSAFRLRIPLHSSGAGGPTVAEAHTYGYDGLRTSTTTSPGSVNANVQFWFTQDYTEHSGIREHYVRVGDRIVAKVSLQPPPGGAMGVVRNLRHPPLDLGNLAAQILLALLLAGGVAATIAGSTVKDRRRRPGWVTAMAGPTMLFFVASCETFGLNRQSAETLWQRIDIVYFHRGVVQGPQLSTAMNGTLREERRYDPFGQPVDSNLGPVDFRREEQNSLGKLTDPSTGWSYHGTRWMQPQSARWLSPDPLLKAPNPKELMDLATSNPYQFVRSNPMLFWDPDGRDGVPQAAPPKQLGIGLSPNFDLSDVESWHYTQSKMVVSHLPSGMSQAQALKLVRNDFATFETLNFRGNNVATAEVLPLGLARFHIETKVGGFLSPAVNDYKFMVQLFRSMDSQRGPVQSAFTLSDHPLQGMRRWFATPNADGGITIITEAYEVSNGVARAVANWLGRSNYAQASMWNTYLTNIDARYFGAHGSLTTVDTTTKAMPNPIAEPLNQKPSQSSQ